MKHDDDKLSNYVKRMEWDVTGMKDNKDEIFLGLAVHPNDRLKKYLNVILEKCGEDILDGEGDDPHLGSLEEYFGWVPEGGYDAPGTPIPVRTTSGGT